MHAMGGDFPPVGGGPSSPFANTWSYLKANFLGTAGLPDSTFNFGLAFYFGLTPDNKINLEAMTPPPLFTVDDAWWLATLGAKRDVVTGFTADVAPPYKPYLANTNQVSSSGNPLAPETFGQRWHSTGCPVH